QLWRGIALWAVLVIFCALISVPPIHSLFPVDSVYAVSSFPLITAVLGTSLVLSGLESTAIFLNMRHLNLRPVILLDMASRVVPLPIMIVWASLMPSVWAIVGGGLAGGICRLILSHLVIPGPRMALQCNKDHLHEITRFGKWIAVSSFASFIS